VSDEIRALTARLADEPTSLAFLELGEALRRRGQYDAAAKVARGGLSRYPGLADAHDLLARILSDQGDLAGAFDAWADALRLDPMRGSALKGLAFLYFRAGDRAAALEHLGRAAEADLRLNDPGVSRRHAEIRLEQDEFALVDLGSTNGVRVNGRAISGPHPLEPGDSVELGTVPISFEAE